LFVCEFVQSHIGFLIQDQSCDWGLFFVPLSSDSVSKQGQRSLLAVPVRNGYHVVIVVHMAPYIRQHKEFSIILHRSDHLKIC
jgi:hypothetical protein